MTIRNAFYNSDHLPLPHEAKVRCRDLIDASKWLHDAPWANGFYEVQPPRADEIGGEYLRIRFSDAATAGIFKLRYR